MTDIQKTLIQSLTSDQIDDLIVEISLRNEGFDFQYSIDNYDLSNIGFPFGLITTGNYDERAKLPVDRITDEQVAYDFLFWKKGYKFYIFDEYLVEFQNFRKKVDSAKSIGLRFIDSLKIMMEYYDESKNQVSLEKLKVLEKISDIQVSLLLSIVLGSISHGIKKLNEIVRTNQLFNSSDFADGFDREVFSAIISMQPGSLSDTIFKYFINDFKKVMEPDRLKARYNDCRVFDRLFNINNRLLKNRKGLLLLSSTHSSGTISKIAAEYNLILKLKNKVFNPYRSIGQIYLQVLLDKSPDQLNDLKTIKSLFVLNENNQNDPRINRFVHQSISTHFENRITALRNGFENASLIKKFVDFRTEIDQASRNQVLKSIAISPILDYLLDLAKQTKVIEQTRSSKLQELMFEHNYQNILRIGISHVHLGISKFELCKGLDYITNNYHHLPLVYFFDDNHGYQEACNEIVKFLVEVNPDKRNSKALIESVNSSLERLFEKTDSNYAETLLRLLVLTLLSTEKDKEPELLAYQTAEEIYCDFSDNDKRYKIEYLYFLSWLARRKKEFERALFLADEGNKLEQSDPRFYQSRSLTKYCLFIERRDVQLLVDSIDNAEKSIELYRNLNRKNLAIEKSQLALLNTLCYLYCLLFNEDKEYKYLTKARYNLEQLRKNEPDFDIIPEFLHTEAYLTKLEVLNKKDVFSNLETDYELMNAIACIRKAIKIYPKQTYIDLEEELSLLISKRG